MIFSSAKQVYWNLSKIVYNRTRCLCHSTTTRITIVVVILKTRSSTKLQYIIWCKQMFRFASFGCGCIISPLWIHVRYPSIFFSFTSLQQSCVQPQCQWSNPARYEWNFASQERQHTTKLEPCLYFTNRRYKFTYNSSGMHPKYNNKSSNG